MFCFDLLSLLVSNWFNNHLSCFCNSLSCYDFPVLIHAKSWFRRQQLSSVTQTATDTQESKPSVAKALDLSQSTALEYTLRWHPTAGYGAGDPANRVSKAPSLSPATPPLRTRLMFGCCALLSLRTLSLSLFFHDVIYSHIGYLTHPSICHWYRHLPFYFCLPFRNYPFVHPYLRCGFPFLLHHIIWKWSGWKQCGRKGCTVKRNKFNVRICRFRRCRLEGCRLTLRLKYINRK